MAYRLSDILSNPPTAPHGAVRSERSQSRAHAWAYDLAQWRQYRLAMTAGDADAIEQEYRQRLEAGPDFAGYHSSSGYEPPPVNSIDKREILVAFDQVRAWLWRNARKPRGQAVSRVYREVLQVLLSFAAKYGQVYPSHATIARLACCSERTVQRALCWLKLYGFVSWLRRLKRTPGRLGAVVQQTSNAYRVALAGIGRFLSRADGHNCGPSQFTGNQPMQLLGSGG